MKPVKVADNIYWVGVIDRDLRTFHGYSTPHGSTYNAYLILDENITLIDTVKAPFTPALIDNIKQITDPAQIRYIVSNHVEMDHSGGLPALTGLAPRAEIVTSNPHGEKGLRRHFKQDWRFHKVKSGDRLNLGKTSLQFIQTPMIHWPDNMVSYMPEKKILFSNDAFGQHLATTERFDSEYPLPFIMREATKYYANIVLPYSKQVQKALQAVESLSIETIAPSHGIIWRQHIDTVKAAYQKWSANQTDAKACIIYDTMWHSTAKLAAVIEVAFAAQGIKTQVFNLQTNHISDIMTELLTAAYIAVGSPTLNNNMLPSVAAFLTYMRGLAPRNRRAVAFGSYGWGGQSADLVENVLKECGFTIFADKIKTRFIPDQDELEKIKKTITAKTGETP